MRIAVSDEDVEEYIGVINQIAQEHPIRVDKYLMGKEIEVDAVCDGEDILIPAQGAPHSELSHKLTYVSVVLHISS